MAFSLNQRLIDTGEYCYVNFFSKKYALTDKEKFPKEGDYQGYVIQRPNHGLAHTLRKIYYFPLITTLFALKGITTFSIGQVKLSIKDEAENMLTAYFFSVVGRESEASHKEDPQNYNLFRKKSAEAYEAYIVSKRKMIPTYEALITSKKIFFYKNLIEFPYDSKDCIASRIFIICHGLDLARCYTATEYASSLEGINKLIDMENWEKKHLSLSISEELKTYVTQSIEATGDCNRAAKTAHQTHLFVSCSISVKNCAKALSHVKLPSFMELISKPAEKVTTQQPIAAYAKIIPYGQPLAAKVPPKAIHKAAPYGQAKEAPFAPYAKVCAAPQVQIVNKPYEQPGPVKVAPKPLPLLADSQTIKYEKAKLKFSQKEYQAALIEFELLSVSGFSKGSYQAGMCHYMGQGAKIDYTKAYAYFYSAAQSKHPNALYMVGLCAYHGQGCEKNSERSKRYFQESDKHGCIEAKKALKNLFS